MMNESKPDQETPSVSKIGFSKSLSKAIYESGFSLTDRELHIAGYFFKKGAEQPKPSEEVGLIYCQKCEEYYEQTVESDLCELCNSNRIVFL